MSLIIIIAVVLVGYYFFFKRSSDISLDPPQYNTEVTAKGNRACLPHKRTSPNEIVSMECAIGLKDKYGNYFGLKTTDGTLLPQYEHIKVHGTLIPPDSKMEKYDIKGVIEIKDIKEN